jgi:hypothetical protein
MPLTLCIGRNYLEMGLVLTVVLPDRNYRRYIKTVSTVVMTVSVIVTSCNQDLDK